MINADRLRSRMAEKRLSQSELARRVGVSQSAINKLTSGGGYGSTHLHKIARELATTAEYLTGATDDPDQGAAPPVTERDIAEHLDLVGISSVDQDYGLGAIFVGDRVEVDILQFPRQWVEQLTHSDPAGLTWARGRGDSMAPTINDNDIVLIDRSERSVKDQDLIWCFTIGDIGMIKRLRVRGRTVTILSDNGDVSDDTADADEINIIGRITRVVKPV